MAVMAFGFLLELYVQSRLWRAEGPLPLSRDAIALSLSSFSVLYAAHSGLAHIRTGLAAQLGYTVREAYRLPFLAVSPTAVWQRWNLWVVTWFRLHVFLPIVRRARRVLPAGVAHGLAIMLTFTAVGAYHDAYVWTTRGLWSLHASGWFAVAGLAMILWSAGRRLCQPRVEHTPRMLQLGLRVGAYLLFLPLAMVGLLEW